MVFQNYALYPHMTVYDNLAFGLKLRKVPKDEIDKRVEDAAKTIELTNLLERKPKQLSGGQRQRVALGPGHRPRAGRLPHGRAALQPRRQAPRPDPRRDLAPPPAPQDDHRLRHPRPGRGDDDGHPHRGHERGLLQQVGTPQQLYEHPANRFVAGFIGSPAMNFVHVKVEGSGSEARLKGGAFDAPIPAPLRQAVDAIADRQLVMGVRPEHLEIGEPNSGVGSLRANVDVVEYLGNEELLHIRADEQYLVAVVDANLRVHSGDVLDLVFASDKMYLFDNETGESLTESALAATAA